MNLAVFASGRGSNLAALIAAINSGALHAQLKLLLSDKTNAGALDTARENGIPNRHFAREDFPNADDLDRAILDALQEHGVDFIALAGYLKMVGSRILKAYAGRIVNIHPALLPAFGGKGMYGRRVHEAVLEYGCKVSGVTVHLVEEGYDTGPPVMQKCVPVMSSDTPETLAARVLEVEHEIYPAALQLFAQQRIKVRGRNVIISS